jgi:hypothetical protein
MGTVVDPQEQSGGRTIPGSARSRHGANDQGSHTLKLSTHLEVGIAHHIAVFETAYSHTLEGEQE